MPVPPLTSPLWYPPPAAAAAAAAAAALARAAVAAAAARGKPALLVLGVRGGVKIPAAPREAERLLMLTLLPPAAAPPGPDVSVGGPEPPGVPAVRLPLRLPVSEAAMHEESLLQWEMMEMNTNCVAGAHSRKSYHGNRLIVLVLTHPCAWSPPLRFQSLRY